MQSYPDDTKTARLSNEHEYQLCVESALASEFVASRGYWTATNRSELPNAFKSYQRRAPALVVPMFSPDRITTGYQIRPNNPRKDKKGKSIRYETTSGSRVILDVHPINMEAIRDSSVDLWITEGVKKGDSLASRGECAISLIGVWNWQKDGEPLPCWEHVALEDRRVFVCFDSDVLEKENVQLALERLVWFLEDRGADARVVYLPEVLHV